MSGPSRPLVRATLDNGLTVLVREDHKAPVVIANLWVRVGANHEDERVLGWSHGIEHMMFKGTARRGPGVAAREVREAGGAMNAGTGYQTTNYYVTVPKRSFAVGMDILADLVTASLFDAAELDRERGVLIEENKMYRDRPAGFGLTWEKLMALAFERSNYRRHIGGPDESLRSTPRDAILDYKRRFYIPNNSALVVVGAVGERDALAEAQRAFGAWEAGDLPAPHDPVEPPQSEMRYAAFAGPVMKTYVKMGWHGGAETSRDAFVTEVLMRLLARGRSSRLYREVLEKRGLVSEISTLAEKGPRESFFGVEMVTDAAKLADAEEAVLAEVRRLGDQPVREQELERAKNFIQRSYILGQETVEAQAHSLGYYEMMGDVTIADRYPEIIESVTREDVRRVAAERFRAEGCSLLVYHPETTAAGVVEQEPAAVRARLAPGRAPDRAHAMHGADGPALSRARAAASRSQEATPSAASPGRLASLAAASPAVLVPARTPSPRFERIALSCGATLLFKRRPALPVASLSALLHAGTSYENERTNGLSCLTQRSMVKGTARRTSEEIAHESEFYGASIAPMYGHDSCGFSFSTATKFFDRAFDVFADVIQNPAFPEPEVERERSLILAEIAQVEDEPFEKAGLEFQKALFASDPYGLPASGTAESTGALSLADLRPWYERFHRVGNLLFTAAGDLDRDALAAQIDSAFAGFRPGAAVLRETTAGAPTAAREVVIERDVNQAVIVLGLRGPAIVSPDRYALLVMSSIMSGMGNRLFVEMRDKRSLCYYTGLFYRPMRRAGVIGAYVGTSPDKERAARETLIGELTKLIEGGVTEEELERAKNAMIGHFAIGRQTNAAEAGLAARYELLGLGHEEIERYEERVLAVTRDEVRSAAERWLAIDRLTITVVRPRAT